MDISKVKILLRKYRDGVLSEKGKTTLESWYLDYARSRKDMPAPDDFEAAMDEVWERLSKESLPQEHKPLTRVRHRWYRVAVAASVLLLTVTLILTERPALKSVLTHEETTPAPSKPGNARAYLTLSDGEVIDLEAAAPGILVREQQLSVLKDENGELVYHKTDAAGGKDRTAVPRYHEITTPRAGQFTVRLPDQSKVWLNAGSSLRFPSVFDENERIVEVTGEAYFEISKSTLHGKRVPFKVKSGHQVIEVLGTQFNVNSYADENAIKTTLVEGSIRVNFTNAGNKEVLLKPGQQLRYARKNDTNPSLTEENIQLNVSQVDAQSEVAWKNGYFRFDNASLEELMRQICRWYNMEVEYKGVSTRHEFVGEIERSAPLQEVLAILEVGNLSFRIEDRTIIVTNEP